MELTRKQVIDNLIFIRDFMLGDTDENGTWRVALSYAISSLKADEMYQLVYEGVQNIVVTEGMTNGDILCAIFPNMHYTLSEKSPRVVTTIGIASSFDIDWWNSPYKGEQTDGNK